MNLTLAEIANFSKGQVNESKYSDTLVTGISKDTRTIEEGDLYIPIIGENFDGHDFIGQAVADGASASLWQRNHDLPDLDIGLILVDDTVKAFQEMAKNYRAYLDIPLIAITGSNGKTTSKDILKSVLGTKYKVHATKGNENNEIGLPLTILNAPRDTEVLIVELGTESPGEISLLSNIAQPEIAVITNVGDSHLDKLKTKKNVAIEKISILNGLKDGGVLIYNKDDDHLRSEIENSNIKYKTLSFGQAKDCKYIISNLDIRPDRTRFTVNGAVYEIPVPGVHEAYNATISIVVSQFFDIGPRDLEEGLAKTEITSMRNELIEFKNFSIIDDSYKANPQNTISAIDTMAYYEGFENKIVVLGDMLDLGGNIKYLHRKTISQISPDEIDYLLLYGHHMKEGYQVAKDIFAEDRVFHFDRKDELFARLKDLLDQKSLVLVKGSRSMEMDHIVDRLKELGQ